MEGPTIASEKLHSFYQEFICNSCRKKILVPDPVRKGLSEIPEAQRAQVGRWLAEGLRVQTRRTPTEEEVTKMGEGLSCSHCGSDNLEFIWPIGSESD